MSKSIAKCRKVHRFLSRLPYNSNDSPQDSGDTILCVRRVLLFGNRLSLLLGLGRGSISISCLVSNYGVESNGVLPNSIDFKLFMIKLIKLLYNAAPRKFCVWSCPRPFVHCICICIVLHWRDTCIYNLSFFFGRLVAPFFTRPTGYISNCILGLTHLCKITQKMFFFPEFH